MHHMFGATTLLSLALPLCPPPPPTTPHLLAPHDFKCACRKPPQIKFKLDFGKALGSGYTAKAVRLWLDPFLRETLADLIVWPNRIVVPILPENITGPLDDLMLRCDQVFGVPTGSHCLTSTAPFICEKSFLQYTHSATMECKCSHLAVHEMVCHWHQQSACQ